MKVSRGDFYREEQLRFARYLGKRIDGNRY